MRNNTIDTLINSIREDVNEVNKLVKAMIKAAVDTDPALILDEVPEDIQHLREAFLSLEGAQESLSKVDLQRFTYSIDPDPAAVLDLPTLEEAVDLAEPDI